MPFAREHSDVVDGDCLSCKSRVQSVSHLRFCRPPAGYETIGRVLQIVTGIMPVTRGRLALPKCPEACPADIFELIKDCTAHDPDDRPTAKECFERMKVCTLCRSSKSALSRGSCGALQQHLSCTARIRCR